MTNQNKFIYLPIYLSDYVSESRKLTMIQRGAFTDLSVLYFQENLKISYTKEQIFRLVFAFSKEEQDAVEYILENYFTKTEEKPTGYFWVSNDLNKIADKVLKRLNASRENGKKGGRGKKKENKPIGSVLVNLDQNLDESILNEIKLNEIKLDNLEEKNIKKEKFKKPTIEEIKNYVLEISAKISPESFFDYYESKGWKVGNTPMKDWKATVRNWSRKEQAPKQTYVRESESDQRKRFFQEYANKLGDE